MSGIVFGKLPAHGDFIARGLDPAERDALDLWLSTGMAEARTAHGARFEDHYEGAPVWQFTGGGRAGALAASVDAVGRRFPIFVACDTDAEGWDAADRCEELVYQALTEGWTADRLAAALSTLGDAAEVADDVAIQWRTQGNADFPSAERLGKCPEDLLVTMFSPREARP